MVKSLCKNQEQQEQLGKRIKELALPEATEHIVDEIVKLIEV